MATDYATNDELKPRVGIEAANTDSDGLLQQLLDAAAFIVDQVARNPVGCNRLPVGTAAFAATAAGETRYFDDPLTGSIEIDDCLAVTAVTQDGAAVDPTTYILWPYNPGNGPYTRLLFSSDAAVAPAIVTGSWYGYPQKGVGIRRIAVTGTWGYCTEANRPAVIKEATLIQAERLYERLGLNPSELLAGYRDPYKSVDPLVMAMLASVSYEIPQVQYSPINW